MSQSPTPSYLIAYIRSSLDSDFTNPDPDLLVRFNRCFKLDCIDMGLATLPSPSEGMFILILVNTATSFAMIKDLFCIILHAVGINLPSEDCDPCSAAWSSPAVITLDNSQNCKSYTQQLIEDFRCWSPTIHFKTVSSGDCSEVQQECSVCLNHFEPQSKINKLGCGHVFHNICLEKWLGYSNSTCPLCRTPMMPLEEEADCFCN